MSILILFLCNYLFKFLIIQKTGYLLDIVTEPEDISCESWVLVLNVLVAGSSLLKAASLSLVAGDSLRCETVIAAHQKQKRVLVILM